MERSLLWSLRINTSWFLGLMCPFTSRQYLIHFHAIFIQVKVKRDIPASWINIQVIPCPSMSRLSCLVQPILWPPFTMPYNLNSHRRDCLLMNELYTISPSSSPKTSIDWHIQQKMSPSSRDLDKTMTTTLPPKFLFVTFLTKKKNPDQSIYFF